MRKCPCCGYEDSPLWENCRFKRDLQLMRIEDFKETYPQLIERVMREKFVKEGQFVYHKTKLYVLRKEPGNPDQPFNERFEAHKSNRNRNLAKMGNLRQKELKTQTHLLASVSQNEAKL